MHIYFADCNEGNVSGPLSHNRSPSCLQEPLDGVPCLMRNFHSIFDILSVVFFSLLYLFAQYSARENGRKNQSESSEISPVLSPGGGGGEIELLILLVDHPERHGLCWSEKRRPPTPAFVWVVDLPRVDYLSFNFFSKFRRILGINTAGFGEQTYNALRHP